MLQRNHVRGIGVRGKQTDEISGSLIIDDGIAKDVIARVVDPT